MSTQKTITVYVDLPEEGSPTIRPTQAIDLGNGLFRLLPTPDYDPEDEVWAFLPGTIVMVKDTQTDKGEFIKLAIEKA